MIFQDNNFSSSKKAGFLSYILISMVSAVIGGLIVSFFSLGTNVPKNSAQISEKQGAQTTPIVTVPSGGLANIPEVAKTIGNAVVGVTSKGNTNSVFEHKAVDQGSGSGVIIDSTGFIVTNNHVVKGAAGITVTLANGKQVSAKIVGTDPKTDLAVLKINAENLTAVRLGDSDNLQVGEPAIAIGNPLGPEFARTVTVGVISALNRTVFVQGQQFELIQTDAAINPGNSGGALVNDKGELVGINSAKIVAEEIEGINFAIPINTAKPIIEDLMKHGKVVRPWLGVKWISDVNDSVAEQYKLNVKSGVLIEVLPDGPADKAGIKNNDVIIELDKQKVKGFEELRKEIEKKKIGDKLIVKVIRDKKEKTITVTLSEAPAPEENK